MKMEGEGKPTKESRESDGSVCLGRSSSSTFCFS